VSAGGPLASAVLERLGATGFKRARPWSAFESSCQAMSSRRTLQDALVFIAGLVPTQARLAFIRVGARWRARTRVRGSR
jgi:hypothetical protein